MAYLHSKNQVLPHTCLAYQPQQELPLQVYVRYRRQAMFRNCNKDITIKFNNCQYLILYFEDKIFSCWNKIAKQ